MKGAYLCVAAGLVAKLSWTLITPWTLAHQAPLSVEFPRQESWSGLAFLFLVDLSNPGIELTSPALQVDSLLTEWGDYLKFMRIMLFF